MVKIGDWVKIDSSSPVYTVTKVYRNEYGELCADGAGRVGAEMRGYRIKHLIKV